MSRFSSHDQGFELEGGELDRFQAENSGATCGYILTRSDDKDRDFTVETHLFTEDQVVDADEAFGVMRDNHPEAHEIQLSFFGVYDGGLAYGDERSIHTNYPEGWYEMVV